MQTMCVEAERLTTDGTKLKSADHAIWEKRHELDNCFILKNWDFSSIGKSKFNSRWFLLFPCIYYRELCPKNEVIFTSVQVIFCFYLGNDSYEL